jgi:hypothetical protein
MGEEGLEWWTIRLDCCDIDKYRYIDVFQFRNWVDDEIFNLIFAKTSRYS